VINVEAEETLVKYLTHCNDMYFGLSAKEVRGLAFDFARKLELPMPTS
ncbi:Tigger transposable element-derived-like protein, partial [Temnothorax longispinosus]